MATAIQTLHDDFLTCIICTDVYRDPCTLVCGHTFCRGCLAKYTKTQQDAIKAKSIRCPNCRQMTKVTNPGGPVEDWVKQIKSSLLMQGLLDRFASQSIADTAPENQCFSCLHHDVKTTSTSYCMECDIILCDKCVKTHIAIPATSHHVIADLGGNVKVRNKRKVMCKSHNCFVEFFCRDCQKAVCQKCCILDHRKCDNVVSIKSMVPEMKSVLKRNKDILTKQLKMEELKAQTKKGEVDVQMYHQHCEFIDQALTAESEMDMYEMYQMLQSQTETEQEFDPNSTPVLVDTIDVYTNRTGEYFDVDDVTVVDVDGMATVVVISSDNTDIRSFYTKGRQARYSVMGLNSGPSSVTRLCHNQVAVSFRSREQIVIVEVTPDLFLLSEISTQKVYQGLTALNASTLVGGSCGCHPSLDILDMTGHVLRSIKPRGIGIRTPMYLCTANNGNILVSDQEANSVYCLTPEGDIIFNYNPSGDRELGLPLGITTSTTGDILVASTLKSRLIHLTSTGQFVRDILTSKDGIYDSCGICLHKHKLYVTGEDEPLKVFRVTTKLKLSI